MATSTIDLSAGLVPKAGAGGGIEISAGLIPKPPASEFDQAQESAHQNRMSALAGLTGMPTVNMSPEDQQSFQQGKAAGAVSVPVVAGAAATPAVLSAGVNALLPAVTRGVVGVTG
jgi:hypothetical protein